MPLANGKNNFGGLIFPYLVYHETREIKVLKIQALG
jgi:hypothetical protein